MTLTEFEFPKKPLYNGELSCPFPPEDRFARREWYFEKAYTESHFNWGIPFEERFLNIGSGPFDQYLFFKGEDECPQYFKDNEGSTWWDFERDHYSANGQAPYVIPFIVFFRNWAEVKAAGNAGHNLELSGNPWLNRYIKDAPL